MDKIIEELKRRLKECQSRIGKMCAEGRPPKMSIPARPEYDDDLFICETIDQVFPLLAEREETMRKLEEQNHFINHVEWEVSCFLGYGDDGVIGDENVLRAVKIMRGKMEAAQRLRDAQANHANCYTHQDVLDAIADFDKEPA